MPQGPNWQEYQDLLNRLTIVESVVPGVQLSVMAVETRMTAVEQASDANSVSLADHESRIAALESSVPPPSSFQWPGPATDATIPDGQTVTLDEVGAEVRDLEVFGTLQIADDVDTLLTYRTIRIKPTGTIVGNIPADVTCTLAARNEPLADPDSNGIICEGTFNLTAAYRERADCRLSVEAMAGQTTLTFATIRTGWQSGDKLYIPGTRQLSDYDYFSQLLSIEYEYATIASVSGNVVTLTAPLAYNHKGARDHLGQLVAMPAVQNLSSNVKIKSESASGIRGYVKFTGRANVRSDGVGYYGLGRKLLSDPASGPPSVHFHKLYGPATSQANGYQYTFVNNVIHCPLDPMPFAWGLAIEDSHYGLIQNNDLNNWAGAGLVVVQGNETQNVIEGNRVMRVYGTGERVDTTALAGTGYWMRGPNNYVRNNVAANCGPDRAITTSPYAYGFNVPMATNLGVVTIPAFQGADPAVNGTSVNANTDLPMREFLNNEVFGSYMGMTLWWLGTWFETPGDVPSVIQDLKLWHIGNWGIFLYEANRLTIDNLLYISTDQYSIRPAMYCADYMQRKFTLRNSLIVNGNLSLPVHCDVRDADQNDPLVGLVTIQDMTITKGGIVGGPPSSINGSSNLSKRVAVIERVQFLETVSKTINLHDQPGDGLGSPNLTLENFAKVIDYQNAPADDFSVQAIYRPVLPNQQPDRPEIGGKIYPPL